MYSTFFTKWHRTLIVITKSWIVILFCSNVVVTVIISGSQSCKGPRHQWSPPYKHWVPLPGKPWKSHVPRCVLTRTSQKMSSRWSHHCADQDQTDSAWREASCSGCASMSNIKASWSINVNTVKPVLRDHCQERPPVLTDHTFLAEGPTIQYNWTCHQRPPVLTDHIFVANGVVFQNRFYCIT